MDTTDWRPPPGEHLFMTLFEARAVGRWTELSKTDQQWCMRCYGTRGEDLPDTCPGRALTNDERKLIRRGQLDFSPDGEQRRQG